MIVLEKLLAAKKSLIGLVAGESFDRGYLCYWRSSYYQLSEVKIFLAEYCYVIS